MNIDNIRNILDTTFHLYKESGNNKLWLEQFNLENQNYEDYQGREIMELMQNADDAGSSHIEIFLDTENNILTIKNYGPGTKPFTEEGVLSIMSSHLSSKNVDKKHKFIGSKGLGFKSVLNWTTEIEIKSDNLHLKFGNSVVSNFWSILKSTLNEDEIREYENSALKANRHVPLPILRLPEIKLWKTSEPDTTILQLKYDKSKEDDIIDSLNSIRSETLLFLHNLKNVKIIIDGKSRDYAIKFHEISATIKEAVINGNKWIISHSEDEWDNGDLYECAVAYPLGFEAKDSYEIFSFFPTKEFYSFPCIIHATLELNASRTELQTGKQINKIMMSLIADRIIELAEFIKKELHGWQSYKLIYGSDTNVSPDPHIQELKNILQQRGDKLELIPVINGGYSKTSSYYYYSDELFDFIEKDGANIFNDMRLKNPPYTIKENEKDINAVKHILEYADSISDNKRLAHFIRILFDLSRIFYFKEPLPLLRDENGDKITGTGYLNTGRFIKNIPAFKNITYVNKDLADHLVNEFLLTGKDAYRDLALKFRTKNIISVVPTDISGVKRMLVFSRTDTNLSDNQKEEVLRCLLNLYLENREEFKKIKEPCYLPTEADGWEPASELIFGDERFPNGIKALNLKKSLYTENEYVKFPSFLLSEDVTPITIEDFYHELGVNKYFKEELRHFGDDKDFVKYNGFTKEQITQNCLSYRTGNNVNVCQVPKNIEKWDILNLQELITLVIKSGLLEKILHPDTFYWYHGKGWFTEELKINYLPFLLKKYTVAKYLDYYIIDSNEWLIINSEVGELQYDTSNTRIALLLESLGAKKDYSSLSPNELYQLINDKADEVEKSGDSKGIKSFYQRIKRVLHSKNAPQSEQPLRMACRINGELRFKDSSEIYYSDDIGNEKLRNLIPVLEIGTREGEQQISRYFKCKLIKDIKTVLLESHPNELMTNRLNDRIDLLRPYILAFASKNIGSRGGTSEETYASIRRTIEKFSIILVSDAKYRYNIVIDGLDNEIEMIEGDLIYREDGQPVIKYVGSNLEEAFQKPEFCFAVVKALCISLRLALDENADKFYRLLKASDAELKFIVSREIEPEDWIECKDSFTISENEIFFWEKVFKTNGVQIDIPKLKKFKKNYLKEILNITMDRTTPESFRTYHLQQLKKVRDQYSPEYLYKIHTFLQDKSNQEKCKYVEYKERFQEDSWIESLLSTPETYSLSLDYKGKVIGAFKELFDFEPDTDNKKIYQAPKIVDSYLHNHSIYEISLTPEDKSLLYFDGMNEYFDKLIEKLYAVEKNQMESEVHDHIEDLNTDTETLQKKEMPSISIITTTKRSNQDFQTGVKRRNSQRRTISDTEKKKLGDNAEDIVYEALKRPDSGFEIGAVYSSHLCDKFQIGVGDDSKGYDLEYKHKGESLYRKLEIKHSDGKSIIMSRNEYETAKNPELKESYDIALVVNGDIMIWRDALHDDSKFTVTADTITLCFNITSEEKDKEKLL